MKLREQQLLVAIAIAEHEDAEHIKRVEWSDLDVSGRMARVAAEQHGVAYDLLRFTGEPQTTASRMRWSRTLAALVRLGLVERHPADGRVSHVRLTAEGRLRAEQLAAGVNR